MFAGAAAGFYELLKAFGAHAPGVAGEAPDFDALARTLGVQFEQWLKSAQAPGPSLWGSAAQATAPGVAPGPAVASAPEARAIWDLLGRFAQLQAQLGAQWAEIASGCAQRFAARAGAAGIGALTPESALRLYELWVDCAEEAYGARVRTSEFASLQAQLANTAAELLLVQRRQAEQLARAWGLPTREEIDGLERQLRELREELEQRRRGREQRPQPRPRGTAPRRAARRRGRRPRA